MRDRRIEPRLLCADLIDVWWEDASGSIKTAIANLEDISNSGVCLQVDAPVPCDTLLHIEHPRMDCEGRVCYCVFRETGYFVGVQFAAGFRWEESLFRPQHLLDLRDLVADKPQSEPRDPE